MDRRSRLPLSGLAAALALVMIVAACSASGVPTNSPTGTAAQPIFQVTIAQDPTLGGHLVGENGRTLYILTNDSAGVSTCTAGCATNWPPFTIDAASTVEGASGITGSFATITRDDGTHQVTFGGAPLYYFAGDAAAGDVNGQGSGGVWFVVSPSGGPITGADGSPAATKDANY